MILIVDKMIEVELTRKVNAGHCYPQRNYPQLAFDIRNVRPISNWENKKQADTIGNWVVNIPKETQKYLKKKSEDKENKEEKNKLRDVNYFIDMYNLYHEKNKKEKERLGIN
ncbi:TPA: hypothetical protein DEP21_03885 [Patescibacteria group bacterium]|nr:hypothetical protein [Candidatus Gracilibacteria bacterium]